MGFEKASSLQCCFNFYTFVTYLFVFQNLSLGESTEAVLGPQGSQFISAIGNQLNGYAEKSHNMLSDVISKCTYVF